MPTGKELMKTRKYINQDAKPGLVNRFKNALNGKQKDNFYWGSTVETALDADLSKEDGVNYKTNSYGPGRLSTYIEAESNLGDIFNGEDYEKRRDEGVDKYMADKKKGNIINLGLGALGLGAGAYAGAREISSQGGTKGDKIVGGIMGGVMGGTLGGTAGLIGNGLMRQRGKRRFFDNLSPEERQKLDEYADSIAKQTADNPYVNDRVTSNTVY